MSFMFLVHLLIVLIDTFVACFYFGYCFMAFALIGPKLKANANDEKLLRDVSNNPYSMPLTYSNVGFSFAAYILAWTQKGQYYSPFILSTLAYLYYIKQSFDLVEKDEIKLLMKIADSDLSNANKQIKKQLKQGVIIWEQAKDARLKSLAAATVFVMLGLTLHIVS